MQKIIARGAEAVITKERGNIKKHRIEKGYRHPTLDEKLRKARTRQEARLLEKASQIINAPKIIQINEPKKELVIENISGNKLSNHLENLKNYKAVAKQIGKGVAILHDSSIIHGDLTTSNLILSNKYSKVYFIDFGLGFHSARAEDKAVDIHVLKEALQAKHPKIFQSVWKFILAGYKHSKSSGMVLKQLEKVESRGRYKVQY